MVRNIPTWLVAVWMTGGSVLVPSLAQVQAQALDAKTIFAKTAPAAVLIETADSGGSGIVLTESGLILTNHHVVVGGVGLKVKARLKFGTQTAVTEINEVEILKVHPKYDLALLQAKAPPKASFIPATMIPKDRTVETGGKCYVIGNPGGPDGTSLELSITEGLVSSASRKVEGLDFIQISAAMNPGNSGGPVCDEMGRVFGIVTWKMTQTEGIGFAIPSQKLAMPEFVLQKDLPGDLARAKEAEEIAFQLQNTAMLTSGNERLLLMVKAIQAYRFALEAMPNEASHYNNIAIMYGRLNKQEIAVAYLEAGLRVNPAFSNILHLLGVTYVRQNPDELPKAVAMWERALKDDDYPVGDSTCAEDLAIKFVNDGKLTVAGYLLSWADRLNPNPTGNSR